MRDDLHEIQCKRCRKITYHTLKPQFVEIKKGEYIYEMRQQCHNCGYARKGKIKWGKWRYDR